MDIQEIKKDWEQKGFSCDIWVDPPGQRWEDFTHDVDELFMLVEGDVELEINRRIIPLSLGEEIFIPAKAFHSVRNKGNTPSKWLYGYKRML